MRKTNKMVILRPLILSLVLLISYAMTATQPQALYKEASPEEVSAFFRTAEESDGPFTQWIRRLKNLQHIIVLDAGHGGMDGGSIGNGYTEKDITLAITLRLGQYLQEQGYLVIYTRQEDQAFSADEAEDLNARTQISNAYDTDAFVSIHLNSSEEEADGFEVWTSFSDPNSYAIASQLHEALRSLNYTSDRKIRDQDEFPLHVLSFTQAPSVLLELGFITSSDDMEKLGDADFQQQLACALGDALIRHFEQQ